MSSKFVLAMYDIRGKQEFIFRSNQLKEIIGGSCIIRDCFDDYLYPEAMKYGKGIFHKDEPFLRDEFEKHIEEGYIGEVIYDGGGNFLVLFKDKETFQTITYDFTRKIYEEVGTLRILGTGVEIDNFDNFTEDRKRLYAQHAKNENRESNIAPSATLPIVQVDVRNSQPLVAKVQTGADVLQKVSKESYMKYIKYREEKKNNKSKMGTKFLDHLVTKKGEESMLAIIYIDGNSMGDKVQKCCANRTNYEDCIKALRDFSKKIQEKYIDNRLEEIDEFLSKRYSKKDEDGSHRLMLSGGDKKRRLVLGAGDEINLICNARDAYDIVNVYLNGLDEDKDSEDDEKASSCAGISIFHSHAPYADAYRIAEECCESGKSVMKDAEVKNVSLVDFHYCQGAIGTSLEAIREHEGEAVSSRPWIINIDPSERNKMADRVSTRDIEKMKEYLNTFGRSNIKGLMSAAKSSEAELRLEMKRMVAHMPKDKLEDKKDILDYVAGMDSTKLRRFVFDMVTVYDLWFKEDVNDAEEGDN